MSVRVWERGLAPVVQSKLRAFPACVLILLLAMAQHAEARRLGEAAGVRTAQTLAVPAFSLKQKPDAPSIGTLIASIENVLVKPSAIETVVSAKPAKSAGGERSAGHVPSENAANETSFTKTQTASVQNESVHYKTVRVAQVEPLEAVSLAPAERASEPRIVKVKAAGGLRAQTVSAPEVDDLKPQKLSLGYTKSDDADPASQGSAPWRRSGDVAIYDIAKGIVYLPDGQRLEAHSGIGPMRDNPAYVNRRNRGPTPPHIYDLKLRESLFHGIQAIRLTPVEGEDAIFGRDGLLAHTYMLGRQGDSNGCVVFREYNRFLAAFRQGKIKQLVVVPRLGEAAAASIFSTVRSAKNG